ncbi:hypothetical protein Tco_0504636 [Tanacetum coccineum]
MGFWPSYAWERVLGLLPFWFLALVLLLARLEWRPSITREVATFGELQVSRGCGGCFLGAQDDVVAAIRVSRWQEVVTRLGKP